MSLARRNSSSNVRMHVLRMTSTLLLRVCVFLISMYIGVTVCVFLLCIARTSFDNKIIVFSFLIFLFLISLCMALIRAHFSYFFCFSESNFLSFHFFSSFYSPRSVSTANLPWCVCASCTCYISNRFKYNYQQHSTSFQSSSPLSSFFAFSFLFFFSFSSSVVCSRDAITTARWMLLLTAVEHGNGMSLRVCIYFKSLSHPSRTTFG